MYDFRLDDVARWIIERGAQTIALQMPEGLKVHAQRLGRELESRTGCKCVLIADPCYGACDVDRRFNEYADVLIQFGHADIPSMKVGPNVLFVEVFIDLDVSELLPRALPLLKGTVGVLTTVQHVRMIPGVMEWLGAHGHPAIVARGDSRIVFEGQVLGCNISAVEPLKGRVDSYLYIGSGNFHPLSVAIETDLPVVVIDPLMQEVRELSELRERILRQRHGAIVRASEAQKFIILASTRIGQNRLALAWELRRMLEDAGRQADVVILEEFHPDRLLPFDADAYVSTACPRIAIDDYLRYSKPLLTPVEVEIMLGRRRWDEYRMDAILGEDAGPRKDSSM